MLIIYHSNGTCRSHRFRLKQAFEGVVATGKPSFAVLGRMQGTGKEIGSVIAQPKQIDLVRHD